MHRFVLLYTEPANYTRACLAELKSRYDVAILAIHYPPASDAPFRGDLLAGVAQSVNRHELKSSGDIARVALDFKPDAVFVSGWSDKAYVRAARIIRREGILVIAGMDTVYRGQLRQLIASRVAPYYLRSAFDVIWAAGERQRNYASMLGYRGRKCWTGLYCCDWSKFENARKLAQSSKRKAFLYVGRYVHAKGLDVLMAAYTKYRRICRDPWDLVCVGTGADATALEGVCGVEDRGFVQPNDLPTLMAECSAFILPSRHEPWGVVVQEAASAGLPLICSSTVGATVHLLQDYYNGFLFQSEDVDSLVDGMRRMSSMSPGDLELMGSRSNELSRQFSPARWADTLVGGVTSLQSN